MRAYSQDTFGNEDVSLIPETLSAWYGEDLSEDENAANDLNVDSEDHSDID